MKFQKEAELIRQRCVNAIDVTLSGEKLGIPMTVKTLTELMGTNNCHLYNIRKKESRRLAVDELLAISKATSTPIQELLCDVMSKRNYRNLVSNALESLINSKEKLTKANIVNAICDKLEGKK